MKTKLFLLLIICIIFSCKKEEEPTYNWTQEVLIDQDWIITSKVAKYNTHNPNAKENNTIYFEDLWSYPDECTKDDVFRFNSDRTYQQLKGDNNCGGLPNSVATSTWQLTDGNELNVRMISTAGNLLTDWDAKLNRRGSDFFEFYFLATYFNQIEEGIYVIVTRFEKK